MLTITPRAGEERENKKARGKKLKEAQRCGELLAGRKVFEIETRPAYRTGGGGKSNRFTFDSPAKPVEKLFFLPFDNHGLTSDAERRHDRLMRFQFAREPIGPVRRAGDSVGMGDAGPDESVFRACQQSSARTLRFAARSELF